MKTKIVVFDFDGVIVDSNYVKRNAWFEIFPASMELTRDEVEESLDRVKETRYDILRDIFLKKGIAEEKKLDTLVVQYAEKYDGAIQNGMVLMPSVKEILPLLARERILYVNSATPTEPLRESVVRLGISQHFKDVLGRPADKAENLHLILGREKVTTDEICMIGDGEDDRQAADIIGCRFIGVQNEFNGWKEGIGFPLISNFSMLPSLT